MKKGALTFLYIFTIMMICFGMVSRAVSENSVAVVKTASVSVQTIQGIEYTKCLPSESIHSDGVSNFVYIVDEVSSLTGTDLSARKLIVSLIAQNQKFVALNEISITRDQRVIAQSDRMLSENVRIRIASPSESITEVGVSDADTNSQKRDLLSTLEFFAVLSVLLIVFIAILARFIYSESSSFIQKLLLSFVIATCCIGATVVFTGILSEYNTFFPTKWSSAGEWETFFAYFSQIEDKL